MMVKHHSPSSTEVKNGWSYTYTPHLCLHGVDRDSFLPIALISNCAFLIQGEQKVYLHLCENVLGDMRPATRAHCNFQHVL